MFILTDMEDDNGVATAKEIDFLNELKLILHEMTKEEKASEHKTEAEESGKSERRFYSWW